MLSFLCWQGLKATGNTVLDCSSCSSISGISQNAANAVRWEFSVFSVGEEEMGPHEHFP